ncbi:MAG TPA: hypothetical protein VJB66_05195 [Candidatus Nanoarchaeia archaeon]|nr:hypothetical protein [Candidatus Nanoarchaeia archaeon]
MSHGGEAKTAILKKYGFNEQEVEEIPYVGDPGKGAYYRLTAFPKPQKRFKILWEGHELQVEEPYYWVHNYFEEDLGFAQIHKTEDIFAAAENSAFFGVSQQRLGAQQDRVSQYLATIGKMVKELFQLVRELRILDERLIYYKEADEQMSKPMEKRQKSAEITLKGIFIDLVQGGAKNAASVYGMSRELEFTTLPDLFFDAPPMQHQDVDAHIKSLDFNRKVLEVLTRHLKQFIIWKERTYSEVKTRKRFTLQYLRQHYEIIKMYMTWVKPYLRYVQRLHMRKDFASEAEIVSAFESSLIDLEMVGVRPWDNFKWWDGDEQEFYNSVVVATFNFRSHPALKYVQEGYQRGAIHAGKIMMHFRAYVWTNKQLHNYLKMKEEEDFELMKSVSGAVHAAMDALGEELKAYLEEAGRTDLDQKHEEHPPEHEKGFKDYFKGFMGPPKPAAKKPEKKPKPDKYELDKRKKAVKADVQKRLWYIYKNFKKGHGMIQW